MGANEKHEADNGGEYTPDTENVEHSYVAYRSSKVDLINGHHEFTRWLETVRAEAKAEALKEAASAYPVMLRDMVSRTSVAAWLRNRADECKKAS